MEIRQLRYFLTVTEELHFGRAAERLHIVQSAVSQQLRRLEHELGVSLFDRTTRTVALTEAGRRLLPHAREVLAAEGRARASIDELRAELASTIRLGTSAGLGARLETIIAEFTRSLPRARLELVTGVTAERLNRVRSGDLDASLLHGDRTEPGLELLPLWAEPLLAALPAGHELAAGDTVGLAELDGIPLRLAVRARHPALYDLVVESCRQAGFAPRFGPEFSTDQDTLAEIAVGPVSWTVYYGSTVERLSQPGVVFRPLRDPAPAIRVYLAVRPEPPRAELRALIEACHAG